MNRIYMKPDEVIRLGGSIKSIVAEIEPMGREVGSILGSLEPEVKKRLGGTEYRITDDLYMLYNMGMDLGTMAQKAGRSFMDEDSSLSRDMDAALKGLQSVAREVAWLNSSDNTRMCASGSAMQQFYRNVSLEMNEIEVNPVGEYLLSSLKQVVLGWFTDLKQVVLGWFTEGAKADKSLIKGASNLPPWGYYGPPPSEWTGQGARNDALIERLKSEPNNTNYQKLLKIIEEHGITDFTYEVFQSIVNSETRDTLESLNYILGNNFKYQAKYNGVSSYANFYVLMVDGEITLIRVGRDKTQVGFYDITNTDFFSQIFDKRDADSIFNDYLPTTGLDQDLNENKKLSNEEYKFYENKATQTADIFWKNLESDSDVINNLVKGLDTTRDDYDNTGKAKDFGEVYEATEGYPEKNNAFVLGEIYGHAAGLNDTNWFWIAGENKYRYWVADVENPNTIPTDWFTRAKQNIQNDIWEKYEESK